MKKYSDNLLKIEMPFGNIAQDDLIKILFDEDYRPKTLDATNTIIAKNPEDAKYGLDFESLVSFGKGLQEYINKAKDYLLIKFSIPSEKYSDITHTVALGIDKVNKEFNFNNSYGVDLRKDIKDLILGIFPEYKWNYSKSIQQSLYKKDNSCALLAIYNLRDMLDKFLGIGKARNYNSEQARVAMWDLLKDIEKQEEPVNTKKVSIIKIGKTKIAEITPQKDTHKYSFYNEPDYNIKIAKAIDLVLAGRS